MCKKNDYDFSENGGKRLRRRKRSDGRFISYFFLGVYEHTVTASVCGGREDDGMKIFLGSRTPVTAWWGGGGDAHTVNISVV